MEADAQDPQEGVERGGRGEEASLSERLQRHLHHVRLALGGDFGDAGDAPPRDAADEHLTFFGGGKEGAG